VTVAIGLDLGYETVRVAALVDDRPVAVTAFPAALGLDGDRVRVGRAALALPAEQRTIPGTAAERWAWQMRAAVLAVEAEHGPVLGAVLAVAPELGAAERRALRDAAAIAGIPALRLVAAPVAIALGLPSAPDGRWLVCDAGAAAFTATVVDRAAGAVERLATVTDPTLGGRALDAVVAEHLARALELPAGPPPPLLIAAAAALKQQVGNAAAAEAALVSLLEGADAALRALRPPRRDELELWMAPRVRKVDEACLRALTAAGCASSDISEVVVAGGGARIAALNRRLGQVMVRPPRLPADPGFAAALGAARMARLFVAEPAALVIDVLQSALALAIDGEPEPLIEAGAVLPSREARVIPTRTDDQTSIDVELWEQREPPRPIGRWRLADLPPAPAGDTLALCSVTVDADGVPRVSATELVSGAVVAVTAVSDASVEGGLDVATIAACRTAIAEWQP
jgi:molecular chaperone DnaK (HSP70)